MATPVTMPQMGYDMTEGSIQNWLKKEGDKVNKGDTIAEIETDKATVEMEAFASGVLKKIVVQPGQLVPVGTVVAVIADENEEVDWKALGLDGPGGNNVASVAAQTDSASDTGAARKSAGEGGEALSPDAAITLKETQSAAPVAERLANGKAATDGTEKGVSASGAGSSTFSRKAAGNLINLAAPVSAAGGPGGAPVPAETSGELQKAGATPPTQAAPVPAPSQVAPAPIQPVSTPSSNGENGRIKSSPLARKVADDLGVDLTAIAGTGPGGRVVRAGTLGQIPRVFILAPGMDPAIAGLHLTHEVLRRVDSH